MLLTMFYHLNSLFNYKQLYGKIWLFLWPCWILPKKIMFARVDFSTFLICYSGDLSGNKSEEKLLLQFVMGQAIIWHRLTGLCTHLTANTHPYIILQDEVLVLIRRPSRFVLPHNFDQFFIHDCFELHVDNFQEYPGSRGIVPSRNVRERVQIQWLKAIYGKRLT